MPLTQSVFTENLILTHSAGKHKIIQIQVNKLKSEI